MTRPTSLCCTGCGWVPPPTELVPFRCAAARPGDDIDHVLGRVLDPSRLAFPDREEPNPFLAYRELLHSHGVALAGGLSDEAYVEMVRELDNAVAEVDGRGFTVTPFRREPSLWAALGLSDKGGVWVKDETGNVSGSHKARHLFGVLVWLEVAKRAGLADPSRPRELAIASCGNAALAAAVVAAAGGRG
ncbi:MAG: pyridoxal-phosphate dependent enzyme, partial [Planctomycetes bacterium]|nr:pyridoxal-phosphate dependent enzyme [Planctomycetota bacterium]